jgi:mannose-6-phosphate isomerase-like protein (cupin superfamily)
VSAAPVVRQLADVPRRPLSPGVTEAVMLDEPGHLRQRRLSFGAGAGIRAEAGGEAWYVITGTGVLDTERTGPVALAPGTAVWLDAGLGYTCHADGELAVLAVTVRAGAGRPSRRVVRYAECVPEKTGDREFRVLLSEGLTITQFAGLIPPGRAPVHHHSYDEVVHVLSGHGVVHLEGKKETMGPGTSIYLPPYQQHCLENTGPDTLRVLGVFHPAGSPAAKQES